MQEVPSKNLAKTVCNALYDEIVSNEYYETELETLSSTVQVHGNELIFAEKIFEKAINHIISNASTSESVSIENVLGTQPELAMKIIPALRKHGSPSVRRAGIRILRDIGTDEAIDQLVEILNETDSVEKTETALMIASLIPTRKKDLLARAPLLKKQVNKKVWPLEAYFPGTLAIPMVQALASISPSPQTTDYGINQAVKAFTGKDTDRNHWRRLATDITLAKNLQFLGHILTNLSIAILILATLSSLSLSTYCQYSGNAIIIQTKPFHYNVRPHDDVKNIETITLTMLGDFITSYRPEDPNSRFYIKSSLPGPATYKHEYEWLKKLSGNGWFAYQAQSLYFSYSSHDDNMSLRNAIKEIKVIPENSFIIYNTPSFVIFVWSILFFYSGFALVVENRTIKKGKNHYMQEKNMAFILALLFLFIAFDSLAYPTISNTFLLNSLAILSVLMLLGQLAKQKVFPFSKHLKHISHYVSFLEQNEIYDL